MAEPERCIYPGCERLAAPPDPHGGPPSAFCELDEHNALTAHQERRRIEESTQEETDRG
jgi:hypothetical protein